VSNIQTGITGLDEVLHGGIPRENSVLVKGPPGSGKTTLALQFLYHGIVECNEPGLIISFEEFPQLIYRDAQNMGWDLKKLEKENKLRVMCTSPQLVQEQLGTKEGFLADLIEEIGAKRVVVDSITHLQRLEQEPVKLRELFNKMINAFKREGLMPFIIAEAAAEKERLGFEEYAVDSVIILSQEVKGHMSTRYLQVMKSRGQNFITGRHTFQITGDGLEVFPRITAPRAVVNYQPSSQIRNSFGVPELDQMLGGGLIEGNSLLLAGGSGAGKSLLGLQFLMQGAAVGEPGLLVDLEEHPSQITRNAATLGFDFEELLHQEKVFTLCTSPVELDLNEHFYIIKKMVKEKGIKRVVIDTISNYEGCVDDPALYKDYIHALINYFKNNGITSVHITEVDELLGINTITFHKVSFLVDAIILLRYVELGTELRKALLVVKMRGGAHDKDIREYLIEENGIQLRRIDPEEMGKKLSFQHYNGILSETPRSVNRANSGQLLPGTGRHPDERQGDDYPGKNC